MTLFAQMGTNVHLRVVSNLVRMDSGLPLVMRFMIGCKLAVTFPARGGLVDILALPFGVKQAKITKKLLVTFTAVREER
jgi:hypothetical protein